MSQLTDSAYREQPSDLPYKATTWTLYFKQFGLPILVTLAFFFFLGSLAGLMYRDGQREKQLNNCKVACHPVPPDVDSGACWCMPDEQPAYRPTEMP